MNSKEALEIIKNDKTLQFHTETKFAVYPSDYYKKELTIIEKDLKVLDTIKSKTHLFYKGRKAIANEFDKWCEDNNVLNCSESMATWFLSIKLKEWLENEE